MKGMSVGATRRDTQQGTNITSFQRTNKEEKRTTKPENEGNEEKESSSAITRRMMCIF